MENYKNYKINLFACSNEKKYEQQNSKQAKILKSFKSFKSSKWIVTIMNLYCLNVNFKSFIAFIAFIRIYWYKNISKRSKKFSNKYKSKVPRDCKLCNATILSVLRWSAAFVLISFVLHLFQAFVNNNKMVIKHMYKEKICIITLPIQLYTFQMSWG